MNLRTIASRLAGLALLIVLFSGATGCSKMMANYSLNQATKKTQEARENEAQRFAEPDLIATEEAITQTQNLINGQQFAEAKLKGKEAATLATSLLEKTKSLRANQLKTDANQWIQNVNLNQAAPENQTLFQKVTDDNNTGSAAYDKQNWDKAITNFVSVVDNCKFLLSNLLQRSEAGYKDVVGKAEELKAAGAEEHNPDAISKIDGSMKFLRDLIDTKIDYRTAIATSQQALQEGDEGIRKTYENRSEKLLAQVEKNLNRATQLGADLYATDMFNEVSRDYESLLEKHYLGEYPNVLNEVSETGGPKVLVRAEELIIETQRASAQSKLEAVASAITKLNDGNAPEHLPGRVDLLVKMHEEAKVKYDVKEYTESEKISLAASEEEQKIITEFDKKAQDEMADAKQVMSEARSVFDKMENIFSKPSPVPLEGDDLALEDNKLANRTRIHEQVEGAEVQLGLTDLKRGEQDFDGAIQDSRRVKDRALQIIQDTFEVVSHNAMNEIDNQLTRYEREGGRQYASEETDKTRQMLDEARATHKSGDYRKALVQAAETKGQVEILAQELAQVAVGKIKSASEAIERAKTLRAENYQEAEVLMALSQLRQADERRLVDDNLGASKGAEDAERIANEAANKAIQQWAEEELRRTDLLIARAREAGAPGYAPESLDAAGSLRRSAQSLFDAGDYNEAQVTASRAAAAAENALYGLVIQAEDAITQAKRFDGWRYESERLAQAIINAKYARDFLDQGNYDLAKRHALHSFETASSVLTDAKKASFNDRLVALNSKVETASVKGVAYYQIGDLSKIVAEMNELAQQFEPAGYEESAQRIEVLEAQLAGLVELTPSVLQELVDRMNANLEALNDRGAGREYPDLVAKSEERIKFAQLDFNNEKYRPSFENVRDAMRTISEIDLRLDERDYEIQLSRQFTEFSKIIEDFSSVLNLGSPVLIRLASGPGGRNRSTVLSSASNPTLFRQQITDLSAKVGLLQAPPTRRVIQDATMQMMETAKLAANDFEKLLILDQYTQADAKKIIERGFTQMTHARTMQQKIQLELDHPQTRTEQLGVARALEFR